MGTPAETSVESWREKMTTSLLLTLGLKNFFLAGAGFISTTASFCSRRRAMADFWSDASTRPSATLPPVSLAL
jgi:hypothetical protein